PVFEGDNGPLFYPVQYEGNESSKNVVYTGAAPNQQIMPAVEWLMTKAGGDKKKFYLLGTDYVFPRTANYIIVKYLESKGMAAVAEKYTPFGHLDYANLVQDIKKSGADVVFSTIRDDKQFDIVYKTDLIAPDPYPAVAFPAGSCDWTKDGNVKPKVKVPGT